MSVFLRLLEERPKKRKVRISEEDLKRLAKLAEENVKVMTLSGCIKIEGEVIYWKTNCMGGYYQD